jgi:hypothetical protein
MQSRILGLHFRQMNPGSLPMATHTAMSSSVPERLAKLNRSLSKLQIIGIRGFSELAGKYDYKAFPLTLPDAVTKQNFTWRPILRVVIFSGHKKTAPIETILDTGADVTIFHAQIARGLGIDIEKGIPYNLGGIASAVVMPGYIHNVRLLVAGESIETPVVFADHFATAGLLGQIGFFNHFVVTFDWTPDPPCFEVQRISRN